MDKSKVHWFWIKSEIGAGTHGASLGPDAIRYVAHANQSTLFVDYPSTQLSTIESKLSTLIAEHANSPARFIHLITEVYEQIITHMASIYQQGHIPFIISGDHSNAGGTIAGIKSHFPDKRLGVIWIDAHLDLHSPYTSPSGNMHGMPVSICLNCSNEENKIREIDPSIAASWKALCEIGGIAPKINYSDIVFIGTRDYEEEETHIVNTNHIKFFTPDDVMNYGLDRVSTMTLEHLSDCDLLYVSFDIDSIDETHVPGTGTPVDYGLLPLQTMFMLEKFWNDPRLIAMEFTEINPLLDMKNQTAEVAFEVIEHLMVPDTENPFPHLVVPKR